MKNLIDSTISFIALVTLTPLFIILTVLVVFNLGYPIFFRQKRPGLNGKPFSLIKFRTMINATDDNGNELEDRKRLTKFGKILRSTSMDELPTLWNVFSGSMSLVGPRPLLMEYLPRYSVEQMRRHEVKPGITGWAQINGRNAISWEEKFQLDVWYVDNHSLWLDIKIIFMTIKKVFFREGISAQGEATMREFKGDGYNDTGKKGSA